MRLQLPSLQNVWREAMRTMRRFPLVLLCSLLCGGFIYYLSSENDLDRMIARSVPALLLTIPLSFALSTFLEWNPGERRSWLYRLAAGAFILIYAWSYRVDREAIYLVRFAQFMLVLHLLVAFAPYFRRSSILEFWKYNESLFIRFLTAVFYSGFLFVGLTLALWAVDYLLGWHSTDRAYFRLWIVLAFGFNTWFFLAGVPTAEEVHLQRGVYPKALKVFTQYVLVPLVSLYVAILYLYMGKILMEWTWPKGNVGYLVSAASLLGMFSLLLLHPAENQTENRWVRVYSRSFYYSLFPLVGLLLLGVWRRVSEYGITERRYLLLALAIWIASMAFYFTFSRLKNIKAIPISLAVLAFFSAGGPWGAYQVSRRSQQARLHTLLERHGMLVDGKLEKPRDLLTFAEKKDLTTILLYLTQTHGVESIPAVDPKLPPAKVEAAEDLPYRSEGRAARARAYEATSSVMLRLGLEMVREWESLPGQRDHFFFSARRESGPLEVRGYDFIYIFSVQRDHPSFLGQGEWNVSLGGAPGMLLLRSAHDAISISLSELFEHLQKNIEGGGEEYNLPLTAFLVEGNGAKTHAKVYLNSIQGRRDSGHPEINEANGYLFFKSEK